MKAQLFPASVLFLASMAHAQTGDRPAEGAKLGRSPVLATRGMVAASQPLAATAGLRVLQEGGNAIDAAIATAAVLNVVEPMMCGIGGDLFALVYHAESGKLYGLNATGRGGSLSSPEKMREMGYERMPGSGITAVTVPGALHGWEELRSRFGTRPLGELLEPAIYYAENGFPVSQIIATDWHDAEDKLSRQDAAAKTYLIDGRAPRHGEIFRSPDLARTFRIIARDGVEVFYRGEIASAIADFIQKEGGFVTLEDLASHHSDWVEPISTTYKDVTVYTIPPNSQGFVALEMLNLLEDLDVGSLEHNSAEYLHLLIEAKKLAFADRDAYLADPTKAKMPLDQLISKPYAAKRRALIDRDHAADEVAPGTVEVTDTVYLTVVDEARNAVSLIYSLFSSFGSGLVVPETGIMLHNRGTGFSLEPGHPNVLAPGKRPLHTNMPGMAFKNGRPWLSYGVMGGDMQPQGHTQVLLNRIEFGMNVQEAGEMARFRHLSGRSVGIESGVGVEVLQELIAKGHRPTTIMGAYGGYQAIEIDWERGVLLGGSDRRKDGAAVGY
ncbi:MAG TPA: gamma-glutamyltransferase [Vicinamibacteria bacterium]|nr:gamma-glutamyltransferase [Vicinamibacteria bacterium]